MGIKLFVVFLYNLFNIHRFIMMSHLPFLILIICIFFLFFFLPNFTVATLSSVNSVAQSYLTLCDPMDSAIRVVLSAYLRLLIFLPAILIPACASSSPAFCMMYTAYNLNKQGDNIQPWRTPFPIWNQPFVPCPVLLLFNLHTDFSGGR